MTTDLPDIDIEAALKALKGFKFFAPPPPPNWKSMTAFAAAEHAVARLRQAGWCT